MEMLLRNVNKNHDIKLPLKSRHVNVYHDQIYTHAFSSKKPNSFLLQLLTMKPSGHVGMIGSLNEMVKKC